MARPVVPRLLAALVTVIALGACARATAPAPAAAPASFDGALQLAAASRRPLLVEFGAEWCAPCKRFTRDLAADPALGRDLDDTVVLLRLDVEKDEGKALSARYAALALPGFVLVDAKGALLGEWAGYDGADDFRARLRTALEGAVTIEARAERLQRSPNLEDAITLARHHERRDAFEESDRYYVLARGLVPASDPFGAAQVDAELADVRVRAYRERRADAAAVRDALLRLLLSRADPAIRLSKVVALVTGRVRSEDSATFGPVVAATLAMIESERASVDAATMAELRIAEALHVARDPRRAGELKKARLGAGWDRDHDRLNEFAWWCVQQRVLIGEGAVAAGKAVDLAPPGPKRADALDTLAEIRFLQGRRADAIALETRAIEEDGSREIFRRALARFREGDAPPAPR